MNRADLRARLTQLEAQRADLEALRLVQLEARCAGYPDPADAEEKLRQLERLQVLREALGLEHSLLSPPADTWEPPSVFRNRTPETVLAETEEEYDLWKKYRQDLAFPWYWLLLILCGICVLLLPWQICRVIGPAVILMGGILFALSLFLRRLSSNIVRFLELRHSPLPPDQWIPAAQEYAARMKAREAAWQVHLPERTALEEQMAALDRELDALCAGSSPEETHQALQGILSDLSDLAQARREYSRLPHSPIMQNLSPEETQSRLTAIQTEIRKTKQQLIDS